MLKLVDSLLGFVITHYDAHVRCCDCHAQGSNDTGGRPDWLAVGLMENQRKEIEKELKQLARSKKKSGK
jgi:hypothetical protein